MDIYCLAEMAFCLSWILMSLFGIWLLFPAILKLYYFFLGSLHIHYSSRLCSQFYTVSLRKIFCLEPGMSARQGKVRSLLVKLPVRILNKQQPTARLRSGKYWKRCGECGWWRSETSPEDKRLKEVWRVWMMPCKRGKKRGLRVRQGGYSVRDAQPMREWIWCILGTG